MKDFAIAAGSEAITYVLDGAGNRLKEEVRDSTGNVRRLLARQYNSLNQLRALINAPAIGSGCARRQENQLHL